MEDQKKLIEAAQAGDRAAMDRLYEQTSGELDRMIRQKVRDPAQADDVRQETYLRAFASLGQLRDPDKLLPWLKTIAANEIKGAQQQPRPLLFSELENAAPEPLDEDAGDLPEPALDRLETQTELIALMDGLGEGQRRILSMYYFEQLPIQEIAERLGLTTGTVKSQLSRGRRNLKRAMKRKESVPALLLPILAAPERLPEGALKKSRIGFFSRFFVVSGATLTVGASLFGLGVLGQSLNEKTKTPPPHVVEHRDGDERMDADRSYPDRSPRPDPVIDPTAETAPSTETTEPLAEETEPPTEPAPPATDPLIETAPPATGPLIETAPPEAEPPTEETGLPTETVPSATESLSEPLPQLAPPQSPLPASPGSVCLERGQLYYTTFPTDYALEFYCLNEDGVVVDGPLTVTSYGSAVELIFTSQTPGRYEVYAKVPAYDETYYFFTAIVS